VPLLRQASRVIIVGLPAQPVPCELGQLQDYFALRGLEAEMRPLDRPGPEAAAHILDIAHKEGAGLVVAGAFGHSRLREFIFGGATRAFLQADRPSLFLAH
jgi:nucleotide-binding universal stress UspA family protein